MANQATAMAFTITSRAFNQDAAGAKRTANQGPVFITDRGRPAHVLLSIEAYRRLLGEGHGIADRLAMPGVEDLDLPLPQHLELARAADLA
jgi:Antitoxin Phd_YefM, type II toxin-antitoxin system